MKLVQIFIAVVFLSIVMSCSFNTRAFKETDGKTSVNSIAEIRQVTLGGWKQWITIRGRNRDNPVILFVNGGPGSPTFGLIENYLPELEDHFTVVSWDQRTAGKSFNKKIDPDTVTIIRFISDLHELSQMVTRELKKEKIFLLGFSWGTMISLYEVSQHPELYYAYIACGQISNRPEEEKVSFDFVMEKAEKADNNSAVNELKEIKFDSPGIYRTVEDLYRVRKWLGEYGGSTYDPLFMSDFIDTFVQTPEYTFLEKIGLQKSMDYTIRQLFPAFNRFRLDQEIKEVQVPVYFCVGKHDMTIPAEITRRYFDRLKAPEKKIIEFDYSGHFMLFEQPEAFSKIMIELIRKKHYPASSTEKSND